MKRALAVMTVAVTLAFLGVRKIAQLCIAPFSYLASLELAQNSMGRGLMRHLRLRHLILACVLTSLLITECLVIGFSYYTWNRDQFLQLDKETLLMLKSNVESTSFLSVNETLKMGERMAGVSSVRGGVIYNRLGQEIATFGNRPALSMLTYDREDIRHYITGDESFLDIYYPTDISGLANPMVLRIDAKRIPEILNEHLKERFLTTLIIAFLAAIAIVFLLSLTIIRPVLKLRAAVLMATDNPNTADRARLNWKRGDEFGDVARALDLLFTSVSIVYQEDLAAGLEATQQSAFAVLTYDSGGRLINVNTAALRLFGATTHDDMLGVHEFFIRHVDDKGTKDVSPLAVVQEDPPIKLVNVVTNQGLKRCLLHGVTVHKRNGAVLRTIVSMIDITKSAKEKENMRAELVGLREKNIGMSRRVTEMRHMFQSCMVLLSATQNAAAIIDQFQEDAVQPALTEKPIVMTDRIATAWYQEARRDHLIDSDLEHGALPPVYGKAEDVEAVFGQAFMAVYAQARNEKPRMNIKAEPAGEGRHVFEISEIEDVGGKARGNDATLSAGITLSVASLRQSLANLGGALEASGKGSVRFVLNSASYRDLDKTQAYLKSRTRKS